MAFGIAIPTSDGLKDVGEMKAARLIHSLVTTAVSGNVLVAGFDITKGFILCRSGILPGFYGSDLRLRWLPALSRCAWSGNTVGATLTILFFARG